MHGQGTLYFSNGSVYKGSWEMGGMTGNGVLKFSCGDVYEGQLRCSAFTRGKYIYADGTVEEGDFIEYIYAGVVLLPVNDEASSVYVGKVISSNGELKEVTISGSEYRIGDKLYVIVESVMAVMRVAATGSDRSTCIMIGQTAKYSDKVIKGMPVYKLMGSIKTGNGEFLFPNGSRYTGEYRGNLMHGKGTFYWANGTYYTGEFKNGMRHGTGKLHNFDNTIYEGEWRNGKNTGKGKYYWPNGQWYEGGFKNGFMHGRGIMYDNDGTIIAKGQWKDQDFIGE
jgi:hypothetical protein